ncbi:ShlB/FhaC/HecB family hemolysin secretion/activation protein [Salmonella enterica]|nr:ShlB/FhaC/HecB family hemolysin secretion/activation protein [Salmonella enterica subsp. enterica serovar Oranienburg]EDT7665457.1 ShlB/FhaC/HecB family hemolysin secretion/activation protein [Salmonella enterica subsp. enterica serovar Waycross]EEH5172113.1 ShlB/FhaC/HecB family hemolysin secretion/activation protein [Salmonella enterica]EFQ5900687.1 ShlB/FhaC/HecB family hemolysin secretion/activation protein [Salmonella enterica]EGF6148476.1 ShlB/FhaC/HecB family hemolysin secretion/activ
MLLSEVRRKKDYSFSGPLTTRLSLLAVLIILAAGPGGIGDARAAAVLPTGAGQLGNQLRQEAETLPSAPVAPALSLPASTSGIQHGVPESDARVILKGVDFKGDVAVQGITHDSVQKVVAPWLNRPVSFADLQMMADAVTQYYRSHGVLLARAILPPQTVRDEVLTVEIIAGKYDKASVSNSSGLKETQAMRMVSSLAPAGNVVTTAGLERLALLLGEVPGVDAKVALKSGSLRGTSTPDITLSPGKRFGGYVGLDNQGDPTTGRSRVMAGVYANELLGYGDQLRVDMLDAYEKSNLFNGSLDYSLSVGGYGTRIGAGYSHLNYHYNFLQQGFNGYSDNWNVYVTHPWIRTARARVDVRAEGGQQYLTDRYPAGLFSVSNSREEGRKRVTLGSLSVAGSVADVPGGVTGFSVRGTSGNLDYRNDIARDMGFSRELGSSGQFARLNYALNHDQHMWGPFSLYAGVSGQVANHNLDSSQKYLLGGPGAVRAYDIGAGSVDNGTVATGEVRWKQGIPVTGLTRWLGASPSVTVAAFYDQGWGEQYAENRNQVSGGVITPHNHVNLSGAGFYTTVAEAGSYALTLTWAHRTGNADPVSGLADRDRFWVSAVKSF